MKCRFFFLMTLILTMFSLLVRADIKFSGYVQPWLYYAQGNSTSNDSIGFTLRRIRFNPSGSFSKNIQWALSFGWDKQVAKILDAYIDFRISEPFQIRIGQYTVPGTISSSLTSSTKLDTLERPEITEKWSENSGLSSFRSIGIQVFGNFLDSKLYYAIMIANPKTYTIFTPSIANTEYINENNGITFWGRIEANLVKGLKFGAFYGNGQESDNTIKRSSTGAHLFYINNPLNIKAEYIAGKIETEGVETRYDGMYVLVGYTIKKIEPVFRFGTYRPNDGIPDEFGVKTYKNYTIGLNYYQSKNIKIQANYIFREESMAEASAEKIRNNIYYMNFQFSF
jgi:hypothetical protein